MSIRSLITMELEDGTHDIIYCQEDGNKVGDYLREHLENDSGMTGDMPAIDLINQGHCHSVFPDHILLPNNINHGTNLNIPAEGLIKTAHAYHAEYIHSWINGQWLTQDIRSETQVPFEPLLTGE